MQGRGLLAGMNPERVSITEKEGGAGFLAGRLFLVAGATAPVSRVASSGGAASGTTTFYRGVGAAEAADVAATGTLRAGAVAAGNTGKYLTSTIEAAEAWGAVHGAGGQVLKITIPADATATVSALGRIDGIGQAYWAPIEALHGAKIDVIKNIGAAATP
jgi:hypothetical protein